MHQIALFDRVNLNLLREQKKAMNEAARQCGLSREQILGRMIELAAQNGIHLTSNGKLQFTTFEKWLNPNDSRHMPMKALPVFCAVVGDMSGIDVLARSVGGRTISPEDSKLLKWAKAYFKARSARREMRKIENTLRIED